MIEQNHLEVPLHFADDEILGPLEIAMQSTSANVPLKRLGCWECKSTVGWVLLQKVSGNALGRTPIFCQLFPCAYQWSQKHPSGGLRVQRQPRRQEPSYCNAIDRQQDEHNILVEVDKFARPDPPQMEISISQESPLRAPGTFPVQCPTQHVGKLIGEQGREGDPEAGVHIPSLSESESEDSIGDLDESSSSPDSGLPSKPEWGGGGRDQDSENKGKRKKATKRGARNPSSSPIGRPAGSARKRAKTETRTDAQESSEPRAGPSSAMLDTPPSAEPKTKPRKKRVVAEVGGLEEIAEVYRPPEWFSEVMPKRSPYFPQLGDELVYFRQGHELYVKQVISLNIYPMDQKMQKSLPYMQDPDLSTEVFVRVAHVEFELHPPRLVNLKLERVNWETREHLGTYLHVRYHDLPSVPDFFVLRQMYDKSVTRRWHAGDRFRCMADKLWWLGTVLERKPFDCDYPDSTFQSYSIKWEGDDQEPGQLSPWDMEIVPHDFVIPEDAKDGVPATDEEVRNSLYEIKAEDWEPHGHRQQDAECQRISSLVEVVMNLAIAKPFLTPVDLSSWPDYANKIAYPIDLSTIKARLDNLFYRRSRAILTDVERIATNAERFSHPDIDIVEHARVITKLLQEIVTNQEFGNVNEAYHRLMAQYTQETPAVQKKLKVERPTGRSPSAEEASASGSGGTGLSCSAMRKSVSTRNLQMRVYHCHNERFSSSNGRRCTIDSDDSSRPWKQRCEELFAVVWNQFEAYHWRHPVNLTKFPDYDKAIDTSMSLQSIRVDLEGDNYSTPIDFHKDMSLIFENSRNYNYSTDPHSQIRLVTILLKSFYEEKYRRILVDWKRGKHNHGSQAPANPSNGEGEHDDDGTDIEMAVLDKEHAEDSEQEDSADDNEPEFEGEEVPATKENNFRRSMTGHKVTKRLFDSSVKASNFGEVRPRGPGNIKVARNHGRSACQSYAENEEFDTDPDIVRSLLLFNRQPH